MEKNKEIRQSEELLRTVFETSPIGIAIVSLETNKRLYINPVMAELFGASSLEQLLEADLETTYADPADLDRLRSKVGDEFITEIEIERVRLDGKKWWCLLNRRLIDFESQPALIAWHYDITKRKQAENEIKILNEELELLVEERTKELLKSETLFRAVVNHSPTKIHIKDLEGRYILINREAEKLFGITDKDGRGKTTGELFDKDVADAFKAHDEKVIETGEAFEEEEEFTMDDGVHTYLTTKFPIFNQDGLTGIGAIGTDITERKKAEEALHQSEVNLRTFFDHAPALVSLKSLAGEYIMMNSEYTKQFGLDPQADLGKSSKILFPREVSKLFEIQENKVLEDKAAVTMEHLIPHTDGERVHLCTKFPVMDKSGGIYAIGTISTDITENKEAEKRAKEAMSKAQHADRAKTNFLAHMSHELRTPLNSIIGFSQTITEEVYGKIGNEKYLEYVNDIKNSGYHLLRLINDVLDLSKIEAGEFILEEDDVDLDKLLGSCVRMIKGRNDAKSVSIQYQPADDLPHIRADERLVKQIVLNLLANAVKYNVQDGTVSLSLSVDQNDALSIFITDTGVGIAAEDIPRVLEAFGQSRTDAHKAHEGTGLGLSISKQFVELHGGTLELESEVGKGTTVTVIFPPERTFRA